MGAQSSAPAGGEATGGSGLEAWFCGNASCPQGTRPVARQKPDHQQPMTVDDLAKAFGSPIHAAAVLGTPQDIEALITNGHPVNLQDLSGRSPCHLAALTGNLPTLEMLVRMGADLEMEDRNGNTPLQAAVSSEQRKVVEWIKWTLWSQHEMETAHEAVHQSPSQQYASRPLPPAQHSPGTPRDVVSPQSGSGAILGASFGSGQGAEPWLAERQQQMVHEDGEGARTQSHFFGSEPPSPSEPSPHPPLPSRPESVASSLSSSGQTPSLPPRTPARASAARVGGGEPASPWRGGDHSQAWVVREASPMQPLQPPRDSAPAPASASAPARRGIAALAPSPSATSPADRAVLDRERMRSLLRLVCPDDSLDNAALDDLLLRSGGDVALATAMAKSAGGEHGAHMAHLAARTPSRPR